MRFANLFLFSGLFCAVTADAGMSFNLGGKQYLLQGGQAVVHTVKGRTQLILAVRDMQSKAQIAITAELPAGALTGAPLELNADLYPVSAVIINAKGIYSFVPHVTLSRDDFMQYVKKEEISTDEIEDDPHDRPQDRLSECRQGLSEQCVKLMHQHRHKRKKVRVKYSKHGPTWVNKTRAERIATGDGIIREEKFKDTTFILRLTPVVNGGKITQFTGSFAGIMVYNEGMNPAVKLPVQNGTIDLQVHDAR